MRILPIFPRLIFLSCSGDDVISIVIRSCAFSS